MYTFAHLCDDLLLHEVDAHGDDAHAQQDVHCPQHQLGVGLGLRDRLVKVVNVGFSRDKVPEPYGHQADEAEVGSVQVGPVLPVGEHHGPQHEVCQQHHEARGDGHSDQPDVLHQPELDHVLRLLVLGDGRG